MSFTILGVDRMFRILSEGFLFGLAMAPLCAATCVPVYLSIALPREEREIKRHARFFGAFLLGRLIGYAAIGLIAGWLGGLLAASGGPTATAMWIGASVNLVLGLALILYAGVIADKNHAVCRALTGKYALAMPILAGLLTGFGLCPPFVVAVKRAFDLGGAMAGLVFFLSFFFASAIVLIPLIFAGLGGLLAPMRAVGRVLCVVIGLSLLWSGASMIGGVAAPHVHPESSPTGEVGELKVLALKSTDYAPDVTGYAGHVPVEVSLDLEGNILDVILLPDHKETPYYYEMVVEAGLAKKLIGKTPKDPIVAGKDVDVVSGATYTAAGIIDAVREVRRRALSEIIPQYHKEDATAVAPEEMPDKPWRLNPWHLCAFLLLALAVLADRKKIVWLRFALLGTSVAVLGFWLNAFFSVAAVLSLVEQAANPGAWLLPSIKARPDWYIFGACALLSTFVFGRIYCSYLCPFGALTELIGRLTGTPLKLDYESDRRLRPIKYFILIALVLLYAAKPSASLLVIEPFGDTFSLGFLNATTGRAMRMGWIIFLLAASGLVFRFFCRFLCPAGAAMAFLTHCRLWKKARHNRCPTCKECVVECVRRKGKL
jgi:uncharacterized protein with FMN-binding domain